MASNLGVANHVSHGASTVCVTMACGSKERRCHQMRWHQCPRVVLCMFWGRGILAKDLNLTSGCVFVCSTCAGDSTWSWRGASGQHASSRRAIMLPLQPDLDFGDANGIFLSDCCDQPATKLIWKENSTIYRCLRVNIYTPTLVDTCIQILLPGSQKDANMQVPNRGIPKTQKCLGNHQFLVGDFK